MEQNYIIVLLWIEMNILVHNVTNYATLEKKSRSIELYQILDRCVTTYTLKNPAYLIRYS